jgi:glutamate/tyrosine decarboxylase-like PLP-dependent enzyme
VLEELAAAAEPGLVGMGSGRYFGFVIGGALPAAHAADVLATIWDQNAGLARPTPAPTAVEQVACGWLLELLGLPAHASVALVTGCQMAHSTCLAAARHEVLRRAGWDAEQDGLQGAPRITVVSGAKRHATIDRSLRLLGLGRGSVLPVAVDGQGRMLPDALRAAMASVSGPVILCAQAGEVNTGSFDDLGLAAELAAEHGAWLHVDGAFGLWAAASGSLRHLVAEVERADSWATDGHKWLNVPYDCGIAICARPDAHRAAMSVSADYLQHDETGVVRDPMDWNPEFSRRARGFAVYAAIRELGRSGIEAMVDRCCRHARALAEGLAAIPGCELLNEVVLNQVLVRFADDAATDAILACVVESGEAWMSGTTWDGRRAIRVSVSNWRTDDDDVRRTLAAFRNAAG